MKYTKSSLFTALEVILEDVVHVRPALPVPHLLRLVSEHFFLASFEMEDFNPPKDVEMSYIICFEALRDLNQKGEIQYGNTVFITGY